MHLEDLVVDGKVILKWVLGNWMWPGFMWLRIVASS
jgi:hypothetical protein